MQQDAQHHEQIAAAQIFAIEAALTPCIRTILFPPCRGIAPRKVGDAYLGSIDDRITGPERAVRVLGILRSAHIRILGKRSDAFQERPWHAHVATAQTIEAQAGPALDRRCPRRSDRQYGSLTVTLDAARDDAVLRSVQARR